MMNAFPYVPAVLGRGATYVALTRVLILGLLMGCLVTPKAATAATAGCSIGVANTTLLVNTTFNLVTPSSMPSSLSTTAPIVAQCSTNSGLPLGTYQWVLNLKGIHFSMLSGSTPKSVVDAVGRSVSVSKTLLEVNNGPPGYVATYQTSTDTTATLTGLTSKLQVGQYLLKKDIEVQPRICTWSAGKLTCKNDGAKKVYSANYTLNVVDKLPSNPSGGTNTPAPDPGPVGAGVTPSPWTTPAYVRKFRCNC